jgi:hypothetical protein
MDMVLAVARQHVRHIREMAHMFYRHINVLAKARLLVVIEECPLRGTLENVYAIASQAGRLTGEDAQTMTPDDHQRYFTAFVSSLLSDFSRYLSQHSSPEPGADAVGYSKGTLYISKDEGTTLTQKIQTLLQPFSTSRHADAAERQTVALVLLLLPERHLRTRIYRKPTTHGLILRHVIVVSLNTPRSLYVPVETVCVRLVPDSPAHCCRISGSTALVVAIRGRATIAAVRWGCDA